MCRGPESNWRHMVLQTIALPTELPRRGLQFYRGYAGIRRVPDPRTGKSEQWSNEPFVGQNKWFDALVLSRDETICLDRDAAVETIALARPFCRSVWRNRSGQAAGG